jgi:Flp pilus assembly pilin Flp
MKDKVTRENFLQDDKASVAIEYVVLVAACALLLVGGVVVLFNAMSSFFSSWAGFFNAGS